MRAHTAFFLATTFVVLSGGTVRAQEAPGEPPGEPDGPGARVSDDERRVLDDVNDPSGRPWSKGVPLEKRQRAYELFREGNNVIKDGFFGQAADKYKEALGLWDHPAFHYNLAIAQMNLDQIIEAYSGFLASRKYGARPITAEKHRQAKKYLDMLRKQLGEIEVICNEPGAEVAVDGKPLFAGPGRQRVMVRPGGHRVEASKRRFMPDVQQVVLNPGDSKRVTVAPEIPEHLATVRRWPEWIPLAVAGASAVALVSAGTLDWYSTRLFDRFDAEFDSLCSPDSPCRDSDVPDSVRAKLDHAYAWQWAARATYVIGGVTAMTSAALLYLNRERIVRERRLHDESETSLSPMLVPHGAGVSATVRF